MRSSRPWGVRNAVLQRKWIGSLRPAAAGRLFGILLAQDRPSARSVAGGAQ